MIAPGAALALGEKTKDAGLVTTKDEAVASVIQKLKKNAQTPQEIFMEALEEFNTIDEEDYTRLSHLDSERESFQSSWGRYTPLGRMGSPGQRSSSTTEGWATTPMRGG